MSERHCFSYLQCVALAGNPIIHVTDPWQEMCGFSYEGAMGLNPRVVQGDNTDEEVVSRMKGALKSNCPCKVMLVNYRSGASSPKYYRGFALVSPAHNVLLLPRALSRASTPAQPRAKSRAPRCVPRLAPRRAQCRAPPSSPNVLCTAESTAKH